MINFAKNTPVLEAPGALKVFDAGNMKPTRQPLLREPAHCTDRVYNLGLIYARGLGNC